jgi:hypothetical protein
MKKSNLKYWLITVYCLLINLSPASVAEQVGNPDQSSAVNDIAYLTQLGLMRGHLNVGFDLYQQGAIDAAKTHMKHPGDELYATLAPAFAARGVSGFADELENLAVLVESEADLSDVRAAYTDLEAAIKTAEQGVVQINLQTRLEVVAQLVRTAAEEYDIGVKKGLVVNEHEYQDALGFIRVARSIIDSVDAGSEAVNGTAIQQVRMQIENIKPAWPTVIAPEKVKNGADVIYDAATKIEMIARAIK